MVMLLEKVKFYWSVVILGQSHAWSNPSGKVEQEKEEEDRLYKF